MKISSPDILHKSDVGGVRVGMQSAGEVEDAFELMMLRIGRRRPEAELRGVLVEKMVDCVQEVILGMKKDPQFGPMLMFGLGGAFVEIMKDVAFQLAPITREEALQMMSSTRTYAMVKARGQTRDFDLDAVAAGLQRISQLATDIPEISELDLNPLIVGEFGAEPMVADARIALAQDASE
jgi:acetyltransferase